nr:hypothetical protein [Candidatus Wallbacteria bacterium]
GGPDTRNELIVSSYSEVPSTEALFNNGGIYGATYVFYTSKCPTAPNTVQLASPGSGTNLTITWDNFSDPEGDQMTCYHAQLSTDPTFVDFSKIIDSTIVAVGGNTTQHNFGNVNDGTYFYRVRVGDSCSFSQFSAVKQVDIDSNPPTAVEDVDNINGQNFPAAGIRSIKVRVTDGVKCADWVTAEVWIKSLHDTNKNNVWDAGEGTSIQANPTTPPAGQITQYSFNVDEGTENNSIKLYISGWDAAKNIIPAGIGGSRTNPKISYSVHSTVGPLVSNWLITPRDGFKKYPNDANGKFVNDLQPVITARLFDEDQPLSNIKLKIQGTDHTAFPPLEYIDPQLKFTPGGDLVEGTLPVELISAQDAYGNALQNITTKEYFVIDRTGPSVKEPSCQPANGGGTDQSQPQIVFALTEIANGVIGCGVADSIEIKVTNNGVTTTVTSLNGACFENGILNAAGAIFITPGAGGDYNITLDMTKTTRTLASGATTATLKAYDHLGNQLVGLTYTLNFTVSTVGPRAEKREPQPDNVKTKNGIVKIRLYSETFALDLSSTEIRINGPSPANNVLYYKLGTNENEFVYDPATEILTFDPSKRLGNPVVYEQGTITVYLLDAKDIKGNHLQSRPLTWSFIYDSIGPVAGTETEPAKNSWTKNNKQVVKMKISDATTKVVATSIKIKIDGVEFTTSSQG